MSLSVYISSMKRGVIFLLLLAGLGWTLGDRPLGILPKHDFMLAVDAVAELADKRGADSVFLYYIDENLTADDLKNLAAQHPTADICVLISDILSINELEDVRMYLAQNKFLLRICLLLPDNPQNHERTFTYINSAAAVNPSAELLTYAKEIETPVYKFITLDKNTDLQIFLKEYYEQENPPLPLIYLSGHSDEK